MNYKGQIMYLLVKLIKMYESNISVDKIVFFSKVVIEPPRQK